MTSERLTSMTQVVSAGSSPADSMDRLCRVCATELGVTSAGVALIVAGEHRGSLGGSDGLADVVEGLQFTLGEGPCLDAHRSGSVVAAPDLGETTRWPAFAPAAIAEGVGAVFAFPLQVGSARFGALDLYRDVRGSLVPEDYDDARGMAGVANEVILDLLASTPPGTLPDVVGELVDRRAVVHQAVGMVAVQLGVGVEHALMAIRARAFSTGRALGAVAEAVVSREERFEP